MVVSQKSLYPESTVWYAVRILSWEIFIWKNFFWLVFTIFSHLIPIVFHKKAHHSRRLSNLFTYFFLYECSYTQLPTLYSYTCMTICLCVCTYEKKKKWSWMEKNCVTRFNCTFQHLFHHIFVKYLAEMDKWIDRNKKLLTWKSKERFLKQFLMARKYNLLTDLWLDGTR